MVHMPCVLRADPQLQKMSLLVGSTMDRAASQVKGKVTTRHTRHTREYEEVRTLELLAGDGEQDDGVGELAQLVTDHLRRGSVADLLGLCRVAFAAFSSTVSDQESS